MIDEGRGIMRAGLRIFDKESIIKKLVRIGGVILALYFAVAFLRLLLHSVHRHLIGKSGRTNLL